MHNGFSHRLRELRTRKGLRQKELAQLVGLHYNHIGRYERGESQPSADALKRLAMALDSSADYLISGSAGIAPAPAMGEDRELAEKLQQVQGLAQRDRELVKEFLDAFLTKRKLQELFAR